MIYPVINQIKAVAIQDPLVNMASYGDIQLYNNKSTVKYPYVNLDIVSTNKVGGSKKYTIRVYVVDRQYDVTVAHNKCELILEQLMKNLEIDKYTINYVVEEFNDIASGVWCDINYEIGTSLGCSFNQLFDSFILLEQGGYIMTEEGDLIMLENSFDSNLIYFGSSQIDIFETKSDLQKLPNIIFYNSLTTTYKLQTGVVNNTFVFALPSDNGKQLLTIVDENLDYSDITSEYIKSNLTIVNNFNENVVYDVYTLTNVNPYVNNHTHTFTFVNN